MNPNKFYKLSSSYAEVILILSEHYFSSSTLMGFFINWGILAFGLEEELSLRVFSPPYFSQINKFSIFVSIG